MLSQAMVKALNEQINAEFFSSNLYLSMGAWTQEQNLPGFFNWMTVQAEEERVHGWKIFNYILEREGTVEMTAIAAPDTKWKNPLAMAKEIQKHEKKVTAMIYNLVNIAVKEGDHATNNFLQWFVAEQVEEESSIAAVVKQLEMINDAPGGLFMLDKEMARRTLSPVTAAMRPASGNPNAAGA